MFYWGDMRIVCKQAHVILKALRISQSEPATIKDTDAIRRLIYPDWCWSYQQREALHDSAAASYAPASGSGRVAEARTRHYNSRYGVLGLSIEDDPVAIKRQLRFLFARESMPYLVGELR
jgi:DnaJ-domain-containing protein 1